MSHKKKLDITLLVMMLGLVVYVASILLRGAFWISEEVQTWPIQEAVWKAQQAATASEMLHSVQQIVDVIERKEWSDSQTTVWFLASSRTSIKIHLLFFEEVIDTLRLAESLDVGSEERAFMVQRLRLVLKTHDSDFMMGIITKYNPFIRLIGGFFGIVALNLGVFRFMCLRRVF